MIIFIKKKVVKLKRKGEETIEKNESIDMSNQCELGILKLRDPSIVICNISPKELNQNYVQLSFEMYQILHLFNIGFTFSIHGY